MDPILQEIRDALRGPNVSLHFVTTFGHGVAIQVKVKSRKIGPLLFPSEGQGIPELLTMIGELATSDLGDES